MRCVRNATLPHRALARPAFGARPAGMPPIVCIDRAPVTPWRRLLCALAALVFAGCFAARATADEIPVKSASLRVDDDEVLLAAEFDVSLTPALQQALDKGVPLYFTIDFELSRTRPFWFPESIAQWSITYRVSYSSLTRQYRVASGPFGQTFETLAEVEHFIGHVSARPVARASELVKGAAYDAAVRMKLDVNQLPKPFQLNALASREWQLASDWYRFAFTP
jgi:hypothetical protein